jgi:hypothetical protein
MLNREIELWSGKFFEYPPMILENIGMRVRKRVERPVDLTKFGLIQKLTAWVPRALTLHVMRDLSYAACLRTSASIYQLMELAVALR